MNRPETDCAAEVKSLHTMESRRRFLVSVCMYPGAALRRAAPRRPDPDLLTRETNAETPKRAHFGRLLLITTSDAHNMNWRQQAFHSVHTAPSTQHGANLVHSTQDCIWRAALCAGFVERYHTLSFVLSPMCFFYMHSIYYHLSFKINQSRF